MQGIIPILPERSADPDVHIASLVLQVRPELFTKIITQVQMLSECTCYSGTKQSVNERRDVLVVVIEVVEQGEINRVIAQLNDMNGVLNVNLVYHYCDSALSMSDEMEVSA